MRHVSDILEFKANRSKTERKGLVFPTKPYQKELVDMLNDAGYYEVKDTGNFLSLIKRMLEHPEKGSFCQSDTQFDGWVRFRLPNTDMVWFCRTIEDRYGTCIRDFACSRYYGNSIEELSLITYDNYEKLVEGVRNVEEHF